MRSQLLLLNLEVDPQLAEAFSDGEIQRPVRNSVVGSGANEHVHLDRRASCRKRQKSCHFEAAERKKRVQKLEGAFNV
jgi:hypothetical protein